jgi:hypothetical protein
MLTEPQNGKADELTSAIPESKDTSKTETLGRNREYSTPLTSAQSNLDPEAVKCFSASIARFKFEGMSKADCLRYTALIYSAQEGGDNGEAALSDLFREMGDGQCETR